RAIKDFRQALPKVFRGQRTEAKLWTADGRFEFNLVAHEKKLHVADEVTCDLFAWLDRPDERFRQAVQQEEMVAARLQFVFALEDASLPDLLSGLDVLLESIEEMQRRTEEDLKS